MLLGVLQELTHWHMARCSLYANTLNRLFGSSGFRTIEELPFLPVRVFKLEDWLSIGRNEIVKTLTSSGTTGQAVSRIYLDQETARRQTKALASIVTSFLGKGRRPMVIVDSVELLNDRTRFNARAAGILGFSVFGRQHHYCLDDNLHIKDSELQVFLESVQAEPLLVFGFTYLVWQALYEYAIERDHVWSFGVNSTLIHGGGWKKLVEKQVSNDVFKEKIRSTTGIRNIFNYYGMVEQVGSIFMECEFGHLHAPVFAEVVVKDPRTLAPLPHGVPGVIEVLSALPLSYPGHALLTEDEGIIHGEDDCACGRLGRHFSVLGRLPQAEIRGCSDTRSTR